MIIRYKYEISSNPSEVTLLEMLRKIGVKMKKLFIMIAALAISFSAQANDIVGYAKVTATAGELTLVALNFEPTSTSIADLIGDQLPAGSILHIWNKSTGSYDTKNKAGRGGWQAADINLGDAFWIEAGGSGSYEVILSGAVKTVDNSTTLDEGIDATGYFYPVETTWGATDLAGALPAGSILHVWNGSGYTTYNKAGRGGWNTAAQAQTIGPAQGFWVELPSSQVGDFSWSETRPFSVN